MQLEEWVRSRMREAIRRIVGQAAQPVMMGTAPETDANFLSIPVFPAPANLKQNADGTFPRLLGYDGFN